MLYFSRHGRCRSARSAQRLLVHPTSVTSTVDALERLGLVERVGHPTDRRATLARITPRAAGRWSRHAGSWLRASAACRRSTRARPRACSRSSRRCAPTPATSSGSTRRMMGTHPSVEDPVLDRRAQLGRPRLGIRSVLPDLAVDLPDRRADPSVQRLGPPAAQADPRSPRGARPLVLLAGRRDAHGQARRAAARPPDQRDQHGRHPRAARVSSSASPIRQTGAPRSLGSPPRDGAPSSRPTTA